MHGDPFEEQHVTLPDPNKINPTTGEPLINPKTGKPIYKKADHLKNEEAEIEKLKKMELFSDEEIQSIVDKMDFTTEE